MIYQYYQEMEKCLLSESYGNLGNAYVDCVVKLLFLTNLYEL